MKLLEDNARAHILSDITNYLIEQDMNIMAHPPYLPGLARYDY